MGCSGVLPLGRRLVITRAIKRNVGGPSPEIQSPRFMRASRDTARGRELGWEAVEDERPCLPFLASGVSGDKCGIAALVMDAKRSAALREAVSQKRPEWLHMQAYMEVQSMGCGNAGPSCVRVGGVKVPEGSRVRRIGCTYMVGELEQVEGTIFHKYWSP